MSLRIRLLTSPLCALLCTAALPSSAEEPTDYLQWGEPTTCLEDAQGVQLRAQCTAPESGQRLCRTVARCRPGGASGECQELERTQSCGVPPDGARARYDALVADGYTFRPAIAEAPPGWVRDARGRVFQVNFDLNRRVWIGARYAPSFINIQEGASGLDSQVGRFGLEFGLRADDLEGDGRSRLRVKVLPGEVLLNPLQVDATLLTLEESIGYDDPFFRITTFWGDPARHDAFADIAWWMSFLGAEYRPRGSESDLMVRFAAAAPTVELWHDADLSSYARVRAGLAFDDLMVIDDGVRHRLALTPFVFAETDLTLDERGFHHLTAAIGYEAPIWWPDDGPVYQTRYVNEVAYEVIMLAINDQPLSLRVAVNGGYRDDLEGLPAGWDVGASVGLRMSFWAPPRDLEALERARAASDR
ncbi:MAG: hypothetical protein IV100_12805 [Myxococcales bacterium]|nr:hypothetical protein [Myxococcales bacterium]